MLIILIENQVDTNKCGAACRRKFQPAPDQPGAQFWSTVIVKRSLLMHPAEGYRPAIAAKKLIYLRKFPMAQIVH